MFCCFAYFCPKVSFKMRENLTVTTDVIINLWELCSRRNPTVFAILFTFVKKLQKKKRITSDDINHRLKCNIVCCSYKFLKGGLKISMGGIKKCRGGFSPHLSTSLLEKVTKFGAPSLKKIWNTGTLLT